ncbi:hypothetical protein GH714_025052 [Hevea brasiliensis]|uniref:EF-hand domain-containing protein n=1 Tax=Hevea brasiliensis TaxID=3981 RepID=A0A6A6KWX1_HEVBR|nr:hypothetical protein GH714_025052 [Hevea brasiliensis]
MAISTLQRLSSQFHSLQSLSLFTKSVLVRSSASTASATATATATASSSAKVADRIVKLSAIDLDGKKREVVGLSGQTLLKALTNGGLIDPASHRLEEIDACSAECEVSIAQEWLDKLPPRSYDEEYVLKRNSRARVLNKHARLGCQVVLTPDLQVRDLNIVDDFNVVVSVKVLVDIELRRVFQMFDRNGDGKITRKELSDSLQNLGIFIPDKDLVQMIEKIDANGDGFVDIEEFGGLYETIMNEKDEDEDMKEAFNVFDQNGDGFITVDELKSVLASLGLKQGRTLEDCKG